MTVMTESQKDPPELKLLAGGVQKVPKYVDIKTAAVETGYTEQYLRDLYRFPGQQFAVKQDPRKERSRIMYDLEAFYAWINRANKMIRR